MGAILLLVCDLIDYKPMSLVSTDLMYCRSTSDLCGDVSQMGCSHYFRPGGEFATIDSTRSRQLGG
jgi:hypothetical protein